MHKLQLTGPQITLALHLVMFGLLTVYAAILNRL